MDATTSDKAKLVSRHVTERPRPAPHRRCFRANELREARNAWKGPKQTICGAGEHRLAADL